MLIILAAITIKSVIDYRIVEKTVVSAQKYDKEGAIELLTVTLADIMTCKVTDNKSYNEKEYIGYNISNTKEAYGINIEQQNISNYSSITSEKIK